MKQASRATNNIYSERRKKEKQRSTSSPCAGCGSNALYVWQRATGNPLKMYFSLFFFISLGNFSRFSFRIFMQKKKKERRHSKGAASPLIKPHLSMIYRLRTLVAVFFFAGKSSKKRANGTYLIDLNLYCTAKKKAFYFFFLLRILRWIL